MNSYFLSLDHAAAMIGLSRLTLLIQGAPVLVKTVIRPTEQLAIAQISRYERVMTREGYAIQATDFAYQVPA